MNGDYASIGTGSGVVMYQPGCAVVGDMLIDTANDSYKPYEPDKRPQLRNGRVLPHWCNLCNNEGTSRGFMHHVFVSFR